MKKQDLLTMIDCSILKNDVSKRALYDRYFKYIKAFLEFTGDSNVEIENLSSLSPFEGKTAKATAELFDNFVRSASYSEEEICLAQIMAQIEQWVRNNAVCNMMVQYNDAERRKRKIGYSILAAAAILLACATATFAILEIVGVLDCGGLIASICGVIDFMNGVIFFTYECLDDRRAKEFGENTAKALRTGDGEDYAKNVPANVANSDTTINIKVKGKHVVVAGHDINFDWTKFNELARKSHE